VTDQAVAPAATAAPQGGPARTTAALPASAGPDTPPPTRRRWWPKLAAALLLLGGGAGGGAYWWLHCALGLPAGIAFSNGRLEADEIDIATKFPGRIVQVLADEGDMVRTGRVVARMDTRDLEAQLAQAQAQTVQARQFIMQNQANLIQMDSQARLAAQELQRARTLTAEGYGARRSWTRTASSSGWPAAS